MATTYTPNPNKSDPKAIRFVPEEYTDTIVIRCKACDKFKYVEDFYKKFSHIGRSGKCIVCSRIEDKERNKSEKVKIRKKDYRNKNKKQAAIIYKDWVRKKMAIDPIFRLKIVLSNRLRRKMKSKNFRKEFKTIDILGIDMSSFKIYLERQFQKGMTWDNYGINGWHIDHIIPLSSAKTKEEIYELSHYTNLRPLWAVDNLAKSDKIIECQTKLTI